MNNRQVFNGQLCRTPFPNRPSLAQARMMPLQGEHDFGVMAQLPANETRVFVSFSDYFEVLSSLVQRVMEQLPEVERILISVCMPSGGRLSKFLLDEKVFLLQDVTDEEIRLEKQERTFLVIDDSICRFRLQTGDNSIQLRLYHLNRSNALTPLIEFLNSVGIEAR